MGNFEIRQDFGSGLWEVVDAYSNRVLRTFRKEREALSYRLRLMNSISCAHA